MCVRERERKRERERESRCEDRRPAEDIRVDDVCERGELMHI